MTRLERCYRWLLRAYPAWYRRERGEEMLGTLLEASPPGRRWPSPRDARALIMGGFRVRAGQNQRRTTAANLRLAVMLGAALALLWLIASDLTSVILIWTHTYSQNSGTGYWAAYGALALVTVVAAWFAPRPVVAVLALAAATLWVYWGDRVMAIQPAGLLIMLAVLVFGRERLPHSWLWLAGGVFAINMLQGFTPAHPLYFLYTPLIFVPWIILGAIVLWAGVDARPAIAMAIYIASNYLVVSVLNYIGYGVRPLELWQWYLPAAGAAVLAAASVRRLRHQAVL
jgi:hypothetical protein